MIALTTAVQFERDYQAACKDVFDRVPYMHEDCTPLDKTILIPGRGKKRFGNECEGLCGV